ncbi:MAG: calcium/sodium antiporter [Clostridia bacterium]|nr:calcium/sodium antiporter [Clostridia bacterium]
MEYILLAAGLFLLIKGADFFVDGASSIAAKFRVPSLIIGLTVVSFGTSAPEAAISISESISGESAISLGNILGSNLFNLLMVIGITSLAIPLRAEADVIKRDMPVNIFATGALAIAVIDGVVKRYEAALFLVALAVYLFFVIKKALRNPIDTDDGARLSWLLSLVYVIGGLFAVVVGGDVVVDNAKVIAADLGMSETLIGLTVVALGTSLPELVTSLVAAKKGEAGIAVGNAVGSCLFNILFILGITGVIAPLRVESGLLTDVSFLATVTLLVYLFAAKGRRIGRVEGVICIALYAIYTAFIIFRAY